MFKQQSIVCKAISCYKEADTQYRYQYIKNKHLNYKSLGNLVKVDFMFAEQFVIGKFGRNAIIFKIICADLCLVLI